MSDLFQRLWHAVLCWRGRHEVEEVPWSTPAGVIILRCRWCGLGEGTS